MPQLVTSRPAAGRGCHALVEEATAADMECPAVTARIDFGAKVGEFLGRITLLKLRAPVWTPETKKQGKTKMNKHVLRFLRAGCLCIAAMVPNAFGQTDQLLKVDVPFDFQAHSTSFPSGTYWVKVDYGRGSVQILSTDYSRSMMGLTDAIQSKEINETGALTFTRYGDRYFLSKIWLPGGNTGRVLRESRAEREIAREIARKMAKPSTETIAASIAPAVRH